jgi:hypothetical protein
MRLYAPGGATAGGFQAPSGTLYRPDLTGAVIVTDFRDIAALVAQGWLPQRAVSNLASIRQRDRMLLNNNGALIQAPAWTTGTTYKQGQVVRYSATNPALIACVANGTSGAALAAYTGNISMSDGTLNWAPTGRISCGQAAATNFVTSAYKEIPTITVGTTSPGTTSISLCANPGTVDVVASNTSVAAGKVAFPVNPYFGNYGSSAAYLLTCAQGSSNQSIIGGDPKGLGWDVGPGGMFEFITDDPAPTLQLSTLAAFHIYVGDADGSNMTKIEEGGSFCANGNPNYYTITWPTGRKVRRYRVEQNGQTGAVFAIVALWLQSQSVCYAPPTVDGVVGISIGDSFHNTDASGPGPAGVGTAADYLGLRSLRLAGIRYCQSLALHGAGYVAGTGAFGTSSATLPLPQLLAWQGNSTNLSNAAYLAALKANVVTFTLGFNDAASSPAAVQAAALSSFQQARSIWPNAIFIVFSSMPGGRNGSAAQLGVDAAIKAAFTSFGDSNSFYFPVWLDPAGPWVSGTGYALSGNTTGVGNADFYNGTDNTHPSIAGHEYISQRMARLIDYSLTSVGL